LRLLPQEEKVSSPTLIYYLMCISWYSFIRMQAGERGG